MSSSHNEWSKGKKEKGHEKRKKKEEERKKKEERREKKKYTLSLWRQSRPLQISNDILTLVLQVRFGSESKKSLKLHFIKGMIKTDELLKFMNPR